MDSFLTVIYGSKQTVFTSMEIALLISEKSMDNLKSKLSYYVKTGKLIRLRRGLFAKNGSYNKNELAVRIYTPAYVSFETVLAREGVIFQYYESLFVASYLTRDISVRENKITYRKLKHEVLTNRKGLIDRGYYFEATKERAFLDRLYLFPDYFFDNLRGIDWRICNEIVPIYKSEKLRKTLERYEKEYAH
ncbi:MAG: hypothetical protein COZ27_00265 [Candidatus Moranbacteria bacterium CG_4_10_14_3_um_filter_41_65]|nr:MAG: hypothetical protein AUK58_03075 [Candidatus Moranbacteria bacterium CG2_30_41_165]PIV86477.1 MAG: hypothetical protein COW50_01180 [Candidatus Moranbacteria bacterium CG17_big_fil_post_rev_8_21_14_2_50_41_107]PIW94304.1 MAG: hypothetical protein COZ86_01735 [Candidatus Moranbacteria bacterium CG_4_8_14_3_um_filter_41_13]PIX91914.1 MAG: hypothetical protein COZ27_00265 [Candidatus Moranbacteria bacterium CG_4_10_14_3_um_filter_41_65]